MTTFVGWLADQKTRRDAVGWFARYWAELAPKPRLSSPSSICSHLEDREQGGFKDPEQRHLRDAYDATLREYRKVRAQTAEALSGVTLPPQDIQEPLPGMEAGAFTPEPAETGSGPPPVIAGTRWDEAVQSPGQVVASASAAGVAAAANVTRRAAMGTGEMMELILRKIEGIERVLGLETDDDGSPVPFEPDWARWYGLADLAAVPE